MTLTRHELAFLMSLLGNPPKGYRSNIRPGGDMTAETTLALRDKVKAMYEASE